MERKKRGPKKGTPSPMKGKRFKKKPGPKKGVPKIWTEERLHILGQSLVDFCQKDHVFHIVQWTREMQRTVAWWADLREDYPLLIEYHKRAKDILGGKIIQKAFEVGNNWAIQTFIPKYVQDIDEYLERKQDREYERRKDLEKYKYNLNKAREEESEAKIDQFDRNQEIMYELYKMKQFLRDQGLEEKFEELEKNIDTKNEELPTE